MKVILSFKPDHARQIEYYLRKRYHKPKAKLATLCRIAVLQEVSQEAQAELARAQAIEDAWRD